MVFLVVSAYGAPEDLRLAQRYYRDEVYKTAADYFRKFLEENPPRDQIPEARLGLARSLSAMGNAENAVRVYSDFLLSHPNHENAPEAQLETAELHVRLGNPARAVELFQAYAQLRHGEKARRALYRAAEAAYSAKDLETVKGSCRQYLDRFAQGPDRAACLILLGRVEGREGRWDGAVVQLRAALAANPDSITATNARWYLARALVQQGKMKEAAIEYLNVLRQATPADSLALTEEYANFLMQQSRFKDVAEFLGTRPLQKLGEIQRMQFVEALLAIKQPGQALSALPASVSAEHTQGFLYLRARVLHATGDHAEAIAVLQRLGREGDPLGFVRAAEFFVQDQMVQQAIQSYYSALAIYREERQRVPILLEIARLYEENLGRPQVARGVYEELTRNYPGSVRAVEAAMGIARCLEKEGALAESARAYMRVLEDYPGQSVIPEARRRHRYITQFLLRDQERAMQRLMEIVERGEYANRTLDLAEVFEQDMRMHDKALELYGRVMASADTANGSLARFRMGRMREFLAERAALELNPAGQTRQLAAAKKEYQELLKTFPKSEWVDDAQWRLLEMEEFALAPWQKFVSENPSSNVLPQVLQRIGDAFLQQARTQQAGAAREAISVFEKLLAEFPQHNLRPRALLGLAQAHILAGQGSKADPLLAILVSGGAGGEREIEAEAYLLQAQLAGQRGEFAASVRHSKEVLFRFSSSRVASTAQYTLALAFDSMDSVSEAIQQYIRYAELFPDGAERLRAARGLSQIFEKRKQWDRGLEVMREFLSRNPSLSDAAEAWEKVGDLEWKQENRDSAALAWKRAASNSGGGRNYLFVRIGEAYLQNEQFDSAQVYFRRGQQAAISRQDSAQALGGLLPALIMAGKRQEFNKELLIFRRKFDSEEELHARIIYYEGRQLMESGSADNARKRFSHLASRFQSTTWAGEGSFYLASIAFRRGNFRDAIKGFEEYLSRNPKGRSRTQAHFHLASAHYQQKNNEQALRHYKAALESPDATSQVRFRSAFNAAIVHEKLSQWGEAGAMYEQIREQWPDYQDGASLLVSAGFAWLNGGNPARARVAFEGALRDTAVVERRAEAHYWYSKTLDQLGLVEEAVAEYLKVGYLYPKEPMWGLTALFEVGQIYERSGDRERARRMYERIVQQDGRSGSLGSRALKYLENMDKGGG